MVERKPSFGHHLLWSLPWSPHWHCFEAFGSWQHVYFIHCLPWWTFYETPQAHDFAFDHRLTYHRYDFWPRVNAVLSVVLVPYLTKFFGNLIGDLEFRYNMNDFFQDLTWNLTECLKFIWMNLSILHLLEGSRSYSIAAFSNFIFSKILQITLMSRGVCSFVVMS